MDIGKCDFDGYFELIFISYIALEIQKILCLKCYIWFIDKNIRETPEKLY